MSLKFSGANGCKPSMQARQYVYRALAATLRNDIDSGAEYLNDFEDECDQRRAQAAARFVVKALERKGAPKR